MPPVKLIFVAAAFALAWGSYHWRGRSAPGDVFPFQARSAPGDVFPFQGRSASDRREQHARRSGMSYLALGDSYTAGESVDPADRYPVQVLKLLKENDHLSCPNLDIIAVTGWTTGDLLDAIGTLKPEPVYRMVTLLIGVNNQYQGRSQAEYCDQFRQLLQKAIWLAGNNPAHVAVLSIPDYSVTPFGRSRDAGLIAAQIDSFNRINSNLAAEYKVNYINVTEESRKAGADPSLIASDGLHFSGKEYGAWARLMEPVLKGMMQ